LDRCLGRLAVANALRAAGETVALHSDHFAQDSPDQEWLEIVGKRRWVVLTKDKSIKSNQIEIASLIKANVYCFNLMSQSLTGNQMATAFIKALNDMKELFQRMQPPLVASVSRKGEVQVLYQYSDLIDRLE
jgi:predicted nuclease of predicted toxin-antitoxin system